MSAEQEFREFEERVRREVAPNVLCSSVFISLTPETAADVDVKFSLELGLAIMFNKPIIALIRPGTKIPRKLSLVVDRFVEMDMNDPTQMERLTEAIKEMMPEFEGE